MQQVKINLVIDIPKNQRIRYTPNFSEQLMNFLVQYVGLLIPSVYVIYELMLGYGFRRNVLKGKISSEIKQEQTFEPKKSMIRTYN